MHKEGHLSNRSNLAPIELPITVTTMTLFEPKPNYIFFSIKAFFCWGKNKTIKKGRQKYSQFHQLCGLSSGPVAQTI